MNFMPHRGWLPVLLLLHIDLWRHSRTWWSARWRITVTRKSRVNDCPYNPCTKNCLVVNIDRQTTSRRQMSLRFVNLIPDPYEAFLYQRERGGRGGGESPLQTETLARIRNLAIKNPKVFASFVLKVRQGYRLLTSFSQCIVQNISFCSFVEKIIQIR